MRHLPTQPLRADALSVSYARGGMVTENIKQRQFFFVTLLLTD
jgi:hypothetical protein